MRRVLATLGASILSTALTARAETPPDFKATAHTVAIVSLLGDTVETSGGDPVAVPDAGFDTLAERMMAMQIATDLPNAEVVTVGGPRAPLLDEMYPKAGFGDVGMEQTREALKPWAATHRADYIVILRRTVGTKTRRYVTFDARYDEFGIGIGLDGMTMAYLNVTVCDARTMDVVAQMSVRDADWGSIDYGRQGSMPAHLPMLVRDVRAMLTGVVPALVHGAGI
jgi:hypothetical protein